MERAPHTDGWSHRPRTREVAAGCEPLRRPGGAPRRTEAWGPEQRRGAGKSILAEGTACADSLRQEGVRRGRGCRAWSSGEGLTLFETTDRVSSEGAPLQHVFCSPCVSTR